MRGTLEVRQPVAKNRAHRVRGVVLPARHGHHLPYHAGRGREFWPIACSYPGLRDEHAERAGVGMPGQMMAAGARYEPALDALGKLLRKAQLLELGRDAIGVEWLAF